jgi:hypothetical protein
MINFNKINDALFRITGMLKVPITVLISYNGAPINLKFKIQDKFNTISCICLQSVFIKSFSDQKDIYLQTIGTFNEETNSFLCFTMEMLKVHKHISLKLLK